MDAEFLALRRRLEDAGYDAPLGIDSFALVRTLFADLEQTRIARDDALADAANDEQQRQSQAETIATLRRENRTLIEANNKLHSDVVAATEQMDALERKTRSELTEAHNAANNYRYQLNTQSFRVKAQETDIARLKHKITVLLERSQAFSQADLARAGSKQAIDLVDLPQDSDHDDDDTRSAPGKSAAGDHDEVARLLEIAQSKINALEAQAVRSQEQYNALLGEKEALMRSIALKEKEIERLSASPDSSLKIGSANEENLQLNQQVDFLTQEMVTLESQLKRYRAMEPLVQELQEQRDKVALRLDEVEQENAKLREEISAAQKSVRELTDEKERDLANSKQRIPRAVRDLEAAHKTNRRLEQQIKNLQKQKEEAEKEHERIKQIYQSYTSDKTMLSSLIDEAEKRASSATSESDRLREELRSCSTELAGLKQTIQDRDSMLEALRQELQMHRDTIARQQIETSAAEKQCDELRSQISNLEATIETLSNDSHALSDQLAQTINDNNALRATIQDCKTAESKDAQNAAVDQNSLQRQTVIIRSLQSERDEYRNQLSRLNDELVHLANEKITLERELAAEKSAKSRIDSELQKSLAQEEAARSDLGARDVQILDLRRQLQVVSQEAASLRDTLQSLKSACESTGSVQDRIRELALHNGELQRQIAVLQEEASLRQDALEHAERSLREAIRQRDALTVVLREVDARQVSTQIQVENLIRERDDLKFRNSQLTHELNVRGHRELDLDARRESDYQLLTRLQQDNALLVAAMKEFEQNKRDHESSLRQLRNEIGDLQVSRDKLSKELQTERKSRTQTSIRNGELQGALDVAHKETARALAQVAALQKELDSQRGIISQLRSESDQLRSLISQLESVKTTEAAEAARLRSALQASQANVQQLEQQLHGLNEHHDSLRAQVDKLHSAAQSLDGDRDRLTHAIDEKCEQIASLHSQIKQDEESLMASQATINDLQAQLMQRSRELDHVQSSRQELSQQLEAIQLHCQSLESQLQLKNGEVQALSEDLANMAKENQFVNGELAAAVQERDAKSQESAAAVSKIMYLEELLRIQKREKEDLLTNYRMLCNENKRLLETANELDGRCQTQQLELHRLHEISVNAETQSQRLNETNGQLSVDVEQYQRQLENLTRSVATLQEQLEQTRQERQALLEDLTSTRSLSVGLETDRSQMQRRLLLDQEFKTTMEKSLKESQDRAQVQKQQTDLYRRRVQELEELLAQQRSQSVASQLSSSSGDVHDDGRVAALERENARLKQFIVEYEVKLSSQERAASVPPGGGGDKSPISSVSGDIGKEESLGNV
ncbi:Centrosomal protein of 135 kDa [Plasmodiophora brassicae]|uniref:Centrosomal protein of 135 kDa n=1 Tax=Plasmodiophora brassicae TaxID=37360 RepID=A0A3P3Y9J1_PLABS|nr:unnamed protein product [Plasmodiophora brassicae]